MVAGERRVEQALEGAAGAVDRVGLAQEAMEGVCTEHDAVLLERELRGIEVSAEVALADRDLRGLRQLVDPVLAGLRERIARRAGTIVELGARTDEETAARAHAPRVPALEQRADAWHATRLAEGR